MSDAEKDVDEIESTDSEEDLVTFQFKRTSFYTFTILVVYVLGMASGYVLRGQENNALIGAVVEAIPTTSSSASRPTTEQQQTQVQQEQGVKRFSVPLDDDPRFGPADAPITIIEFSDYQCPYCTRFHQQTFGPLIEKYGDKIQFVYRDLPLTNIHSEAFPAAIAANCAGEQAAYWQYHGLLFDGGPEALNSDNYLVYADRIGLDLTAFQECQESGRWDAEIQADLDYALSLGVRSTPTFFINGIPIVGAQPLEVFVNLIDAELAGENQ